MVKKAELHVHLEGTISPELARTLAKRNQLDIPDGLIAPDNTRYLFDNFLHFLTVYDTLADLIRVPQDYYDITFDYLKRNAADDVLYIEMMYSPEHAEKVSGIPSKEHIAAIEAAIKDAETQHGIMGRILMTGVRHFGVEAVNKVAEETVNQNSPYIVGFGLGGDEAGFPPKLFAEAYHKVHEAGLGTTVHSGEFADQNGMLEALKHLPVQRLGHALYALKSPELTAIMKERNIAIESCPSSTVCFGLRDNLSEHPFPEFLKAGLRVSLNSDDPPFVDTTVAKEYERMQQTFNLSDETMRHITLMALDAAFIDEETRGKLKARV